MSVALHSCSPGSTSDPCQICREPLDREAVAHGMENFHKMCKKCARAWLLINPTCPGCRVPVANVSSLFSWKERIFTWLGNTGKSLKNIYSNPHEPRALPLASLASICIILAQRNPGMLLIGVGMTAGVCAGVTASKFARIQNSEAAILGAMLVTAIVVNSNELAAMSFNDFMKKLMAED